MFVRMRWSIWYHRAAGGSNGDSSLVVFQICRRDRILSGGGPVPEDSQVSPRWDRWVKCGSLHVTNTNTGDLGAGRWPKLLLAAIAMTMLSAVHAQAQTWYLMAPDEKIMSNPRVSLRLLRGPVVGPLEFTSREKFPSREECEPARRKLITEWRQQSVMQRGHWARYGFNSPSPFILCIPDNNRHLKRASADTLPSMETFVNRPPHR